MDGDNMNNFAKSAENIKRIYHMNLRLSSSLKSTSYKLQVTGCRLQVSRRRRVRLWRKT